MRDQFKDVIERLSGVGSAAMRAQQIEETWATTKKPFEDLAVGSSIQKYLKDYEQVNKQWKVPSEILAVVGSFKELQAQLGKVTLPTIDWGSAAALAKLLGQEGIEEQLAHLGIDLDGSLHEPPAAPEKGILSRKQTDAVALVSLLLGILFFLYQEIASRQEKAQMEAFQVQTASSLQAQMKQIQSLSILIEKALVQAAKEPEDRFVVRKRTATVRLKPKHGAAAEGKLLPNEVVRAIDRNGKWVEVEYYHWLYEEYRTGWVLKKYLERVPANHKGN